MSGSFVEARRLEAHVRELRDVHLERHAVLQAQRDRDHERVHQAGEGRALLRDVDEDVAGRAVVEDADVDVALVLADAELAADLGAVVRQAAALRRGERAGRRAERRLLALVALARERLRDLAVVAVDRDRLDAELPRVDVQLRDVVDRGRLGQVHGLRDRARDERLDRAHHLHVAAVVDGPLADGAVEDRVVLGLHVRRADDVLRSSMNATTSSTSFGA